jgi:transcriptional antiterminator RfaH
MTVSFELPLTPAWYVVQTKPRKEQEVFSKLCARGLDSLFPTILDGTTLRRRHFTMEKPLFPSYVFVKMIPSLSYYRIKWTRGVARVVGWGDMPAPIADEAIEIIRSRMDDQGRVTVGLDLKPGEEVRINAGPLKDLMGIFDGPISTRGRVRILLQLVDSQVHVNIAESLVERIK